jgi:hypothetical protein
VGAKEEIGKQGGREGFYMAPPQKEKQKAPWNLKKSIIYVWIYTYMWNTYTNSVLCLTGATNFGVGQVQEGWWPLTGLSSVLDSVLRLFPMCLPVRKLSIW